MVNFVERVLTYPDFSRQFRCGKDMITMFNCPLEARLMKNRFTDLWSECNYIFYVIDGRKVWHTARGTYDMRKGDCIFVQKGASIIEQFFDIGFCLVLFFIPDHFICETLKSRSTPIQKWDREYDSVIPLECSENLELFFQSMASYFARNEEPDKSLIELKFRELILTIADNPKNEALLSYFCSLNNAPNSVSLQRVMENNYCFNLSLAQYAKLCNKSVSGFKRAFQQTMHTSPGKWLLEKRLIRSYELLKNGDKSISEVAFESGFENTSHFSRAFKTRFNKTPTSIKMQLLG